MKYFKNESGTVYAYEDDVDEKYVKNSLTKISEADALALASPAPTQAELVLLAEQQKTALRITADVEIKWRQYAVDAGIATAEEAAALAEWTKYLVLLMRIDATTAPNIQWPPVPTIVMSE